MMGCLAAHPRPEGPAIAKRAQNPPRDAPGAAGLRAKSRTKGPTPGRSRNYAADPKGSEGGEPIRLDRPAEQRPRGKARAESLS